MRWIVLFRGSSAFCEEARFAAARESLATETQLRVSVAEAHHRDSVATLMPVPRPEGPHVRRGGKVVSERLLERSGPMAVEDAALRRAARVERVEEPVNFPDELLDPEPADVEPVLGGAQRVRPRLLRRVQPLGARPPEPGVACLAAEGEEVGDGTPHLERPGLDERDAAIDLDDLPLLAEGDDPDAGARLHAAVGSRLRAGLRLRLRAPRGVRDGGAPRVERPLRVGCSLHGGLRLERGEEVRHLGASGLDLLRERLAHARRRLPLRAARRLLRRPGPLLGAAGALVRFLRRAPLRLEPRPLVLERAKRLAQRAAVAAER